MKTSSTGRAAIMQREGVRLAAYRDTRDILTIGVGHTSAAGAPRVWPWSRITREEADRVLANDLAEFERAVNEAVKATMTQNEFDAMVSLAFNIGAGGFRGSAVVHRLNAGDRAGAANAFLMWDKPAVLKSRRESERRQFLS